jgi:DNA-directed RNA polymerase subunit RPC12/RpoP
MAYRIIHYFEDCCRALCLSCRHEFILFEDTEYQYCPRCGEKTSPVKRNKRFPAPRPKSNIVIENGKICYAHSPHLILEVAQRDERGRMSSIRLYCHTEVGGYIEDTSSSVGMVNIFNKLCSKYDYVQLRLLKGSESRVVKSNNKQ